MAPTTSTRHTGTRSSARAQRRTAARTAVLTVALPSAATLGVFAAAAAVVQSEGTAHRPAPPRPAPTPPRPDGGSADAADAAERNAAERAARERAREDLARRQEEERRRQDAARPHFALPVTQHGLSALFGEAGTHWSARHTGIDFPVQSGTPVMAATDGTVATHWSPAYGYLAAVTAPDGTQTWYGHLRSYRIRKGPVRAGDVIAYSGSSGNSTGPHLHFEVRPAGGTPVDPLPWLLAGGLDPR